MAKCLGDVLESNPNGMQKKSVADTLYALQTPRDHPKGVHACKDLSATLSNIVRRSRACLLCALMRQFTCLCFAGVQQTFDIHAEGFPLC